jgi:hypothetical protein
MQGADSPPVAPANTPASPAMFSLAAVAARRTAEERRSLPVPAAAVAQAIEQAAGSISSPTAAVEGTAAGVVEAEEAPAERRVSLAAAQPRRASFVALPARHAEPTGAAAATPSAALAALPMAAASPAAAPAPASPAAISHAAPSPAGSSAAAAPAAVSPAAAAPATAAASPAPATPYAATEYDGDDDVVMMDAGE